MSGRRAARRYGAAALVAAGALGLHELRYVLVYRHDAGEVLALEGHAYLALITPAIAGAMVLGFGRAVAGLAGARTRERVAPSLTTAWLLATVALLGSYCAQEWLEGAILAGHPAGLDGVFGNGGWSAVLLAAAIGLLVALALRGAEEALAVTVCGARLRLRHHDYRSVLGSQRLPARAARDVVARFLAGRGPPVRSV